MYSNTLITIRHTTANDQTQSYYQQKNKMNPGKKKLAAVWTLTPTWPWDRRAVDGVSRSRPGRRAWFEVWLSATSSEQCWIRNDKHTMSYYDHVALNFGGAFFHEHYENISNFYQLDKIIWDKQSLKGFNYRGLVLYSILLLHIHMLSPIKRRNFELERISEPDHVIMQAAVIYSLWIFDESLSPLTGYVEVVSYRWRVCEIQNLYLIHIHMYAHTHTESLWLLTSFAWCRWRLNVVDSNGHFFSELGQGSFSFLSFVRLHL